MPYTEASGWAREWGAERQTHDCRFSVRVESEEITLLGHSCVDHEADWGRRSRWIADERRKKVGVGERVKREIPPDMVKA
jgi:hypothetical protein